MKRKIVPFSGNGHILVTLMFLLFLPFSVNARKNDDAKIITSTGDTLTGKYARDPAQTNLHRITLLPGDPSASPRVIVPAQVKKAYLGDKFIEPEYVHNDVDSQQVFLHRITFGYYTLFEGTGENGSPLYYLKLKNNKILLIPPEDPIPFLEQHFAKCPSVKPKRTYYDAVSLSNLIYKYGPCMDPGKYSRARTKYNIRFSLGISAGYNLSGLHFAKENHEYPPDDFDKGGGSDLAFLIVLNFKRSLEFETGMGITHVGGHLDKDGIIVDVNRSDLYLPFLFRIVPRNRSSFRPFIEGGLSPMFLTNNKTTVTLTGEDTYTIDPASTRLSFTGGAGFYYLAGKHQFRLKFDYQNIHYLFSNKGAVHDTYMDGASYLFSLAYLFRVSK